MSIRAYQTTSARAENPRDTEYRLFGQVTRALIEAAEADPIDIAKQNEALDWNRRLWSTLSTACADSSNALPQSLRAQIISISLWVGRHTSAVIMREETVAPLIDINRIIMQGLASQIEPE